MAFTYLILNTVFTLVIGIAFIVKVGRPSKNWWITLAGVMALTLVFDNLAIWAGFFSYNTSLISGLYIGLAPIEDFFYALIVCLLVPVLVKTIPAVSIPSSTQEFKP